MVLDLSHDLGRVSGLSENASTGAEGQTPDLIGALDRADSDLVEPLVTELFAGQSMYSVFPGCVYSTEHQQQLTVVDGDELSQLGNVGANGKGSHHVGLLRINEQIEAEDTPESLLVARQVVTDGTVLGASASASAELGGGSSSCMLPPGGLDLLADSQNGGIFQEVLVGDNGALSLVRNMAVIQEVLPGKFNCK